MSHNINLKETKKKRKGKGKGKTEGKLKHNWYIYIYSIFFFSLYDFKIDFQKKREPLLSCLINKKEEIVGQGDRGPR